jgi:hypothetical protein
MSRTYELHHVNRLGHELVHELVTDDTLAPGAVIRSEGRDWIVDRLDGSRVFLEPARYRLVLRHPEGEVEPGAFRRYRPDAPRAGHTFSTVVGGAPVVWVVVDERVARGEDGKPYLELTAERDHSERDEPPSLPEHELEHTLARDNDAREEAAAGFARAEEAGLLVELVALEPEEAPDWDEAARYIDALIIEEIEDDLLVLCGVNPDRDPPETWIEMVKERLRADLEGFRADIEGDHDEIEEWDFRDGKVFAASGTFDDQSNADNGFGWMARLVDASATAAAGLTRIRRADLDT